MNTAEAPITLFSIDFHCQDILGGNLGEDPIDFVTDYKFKIHTWTDESGKNEELVGKGKLSLIHFSLAMDADFPLVHVMDTSATLMEMAEELFNLEEGSNPYGKLAEYFGEVPLLNDDVCFVEKVEVLPAYRGQGLGRAALISIARKFYNSCGLIILKAYPLQHEDEGRPKSEDEWTKAMRFDEMEHDFERSQYQLYHYYTQMGMKNPVDPAYFLARPHELAHLAPFGEG